MAGQTPRSLHTCRSTTIGAFLSRWGRARRSFTSSTWSPVGFTVAGAPAASIPLATSRILSSPPSWIGWKRGSSITRLLRSEEHTSELQSHHDLVCRLLLEKKKKKKNVYT